MTSGPRRLRATDALALAILLLVAAGPIGIGLFTSPADAGSAAARVRDARETENRRVRESGVMPVWDTAQFGGRPYIAAFDSQVIYPPSLLLQLVPVDMMAAIGFALHAWLAGLGAYFVMRQLDATRPASLAGGAAAVLATVASPAIGLPQDLEAQRLAWVPVSLAAAMWSTRWRRWLPHPVLVVALVMVALSGSLRASIYAAGAVLAWYVFVVMWPDEGARSRRELPVQFLALCCLVAGLTAFLTVPVARLWWSAGRAGGLSTHQWAESPPAAVGKAPLDEQLAAALVKLRGRRTLSVCRAAVDEADLLALEIPSAGGLGGAFLSDYARFVTLASGLYPEKPWLYEGIDGSGPPARPDLLTQLGVEFLVSCDRPDPERWEPIADAGGATISRNRQLPGGAVWTCPPEQVGRNELEYRVRRYRYDASLTLRGAGPLIHVRWLPDLNDADRARAEAQLRIIPERFLGERTWQYELFDSSPVNVETIVRHPLVEDTAGLNRSNFDVIAAAPDFEGEPRTEWLIGSQPCADTRPATMAGPAGAEGRLIAQVDAPRDGLVLFRTTYYPLHAAWVDDVRTTPVKVNLAFAAVPVPAGNHRVELGYDPRGFLAGRWLSIAAVVVWLGSEWRRRGQRRTS